MTEPVDERGEGADPMASMPIGQRRHVFTAALAAAMVPFAIQIGRVPALLLVLGYLATVLAWSAARFVVLRLLAHQIDVAMRRDDDDGALRWLSRLATLVPRNDAVVLGIRATLLAIHADAEDWGRVRSLFPREVPPSLTATPVGAVAANNVAWCLVLMGESERALALAERTLALVDREVPGIAPRSKLYAVLVGTLGAALQKAGRHREAIDRLREALAIGGERKHQSIRAFLLGEALAGCGDDALAGEAYARAVRESPGGRWARRAEERLAAMKPFR